MCILTIKPFDFEDMDDFKLTKEELGDSDMGETSAEPTLENWKAEALASREKLTTAQATIKEQAERIRDLEAQLSTPPESNVMEKLGEVREAIVELDTWFENMKEDQECLRKGMDEAEKNWNDATMGYSFDFSKLKNAIKILNELMGER